MQARFQVRILILVSTIYIVLIPRDMNNAREWFLSHQSGANELQTVKLSSFFSPYIRESGEISTLTLERIESYVVLAEVVSHPCAAKVQ